MYGHGLKYSKKTWAIPTWRDDPLPCSIHNTPQAIGFYRTDAISKWFCFGDQAGRCCEYDFTIQSDDTV